MYITTSFSMLSVVQRDKSLIKNIMHEIKTPFSYLENKSGKLKDWYSIPFVETLGEQIEKLDRKAFVSEYKSFYSSLELKERLKLIANLLDKYLEGPYQKKLKIFESLLGEKYPYEEGMYNHGFYLYPISQYVEIFGLQDIDASLDFIEKLTMRFTGEWAIRPLANEDQKTVLKKMKDWSKHENLHVRRLSSEGLRAKLPWGTKIEWINKSPEKSLPIYNKLRNDKSLYVRRSVANSMGDMIKINDELAFNTLNQWLEKKKTKENLWVIKHAIRTPVKKENKKYIKMKKQIEKLIKEMK